MDQPAYSKRLVRLAALALLAAWLSLAPASPLLPADTPGSPPPRVLLEVFTRDGCPHCAAAKEYLAVLQRERPHLLIVWRDVGRDPDASARLRQLAVEHGATAVGVPAFLLKGELLIGFRDGDTTGARLKELIDRGTPSSPAVPPAACGPEIEQPCEPAAANDGIDVPWLGHLSVRDLGLPLFTVAIGLLDGFNPCAMWVLLFLLSLLVNLQSRAKMAAIAGTFIAVSGLAYFSFMAAWLNVFLLVGFSRPVQVLLGLVAVVVGSLNVKEFFAWGIGPFVGIPERAKPGLYQRVRRIVYAERLLPALIGATVLALLVNVVELLCTAGLPALYTHILTMQPLTPAGYYGYLALYNLAYMFDDSVMVGAAIVLLNRRKLQEREGRWLKLVSGLVMTLLGLLLLIKPDWLG